MKNRSQHHRLPISDPPDDWGDGSWTVDCVCGVNFDDGEEMVNCDECGVWVHTRCSRFVKGETSFTCDKCKSKKTRNESEETEVAQLLVELPTKTMSMNNVYPPPAPRRPRLWTDIPIEERVHVQGDPGGDPNLFHGLSSVFTSELWKCAGYVPKKFNFQYREFPCWDEKATVASAKIEENENPIDRGADVLFSLSKEIVLSSPPVDSLRRSEGEREGWETKKAASLKEMKRREGKGLCVGRLQSSVKRERNQIRISGVHSSKMKKEDSGGTKERNGKKKARSIIKVADFKRRGTAPAIDMPKLEFTEDGGFKVGNTDIQNSKNEERKETILAEPNIDGPFEAVDNSDESKHLLVSKENAGYPSDEAPRHNFTPEIPVKAEKLDQTASTRSGISPTTESVAVPRIETNDVARVTAKQEDVNTAVDGLNNVNDTSHYLGDLNGGSSTAAADSQKLKSSHGELRSIAPDVAEVGVLQDSNGAESLKSLQINIKVEKEIKEEQATGDSEFSAREGKLDVAKHLPQHLGNFAGHLSKNNQVHDMAVSSLLSGDPKSQDGGRELEAVSHHDTDKIAEQSVSRSGEPRHFGQESDGPAAHTTLQENSLKLREVANYVKEPAKSAGANVSTSAPSLRKLIVGIGKSTSSTIVLSKSVSGSQKTLGTSSPTAMKPTLFSKQRVKVKSRTDGKKDNGGNALFRDESTQEVPRRPTKDHPKSSTNSGSKLSQQSRITHSSASKYMSSDSKEEVLCPSSKASVAQKELVSSVSGESRSLSECQIASSVQNKTTTSGSCQKSEKNNQSSSLLSSKVFSHSPSMHPPAPVNPSATLSDEELALLLHQELNSSPRVPRVPRVRHPGTITHLTSPTVTSKLLKRSSSSGAKDQILVSRRKNKEDNRDSSRNSREQIDETKKSDRLSSSPDRRRHDPVLATDGSNRSPDIVSSLKKTLPLASVANSCSSSSIEASNQNQSSLRSSPRDFSDDDAGAVAGCSPRTLPGLIDEIMSKGTRMSYEELCNAVLPHWHNLRKHNGERYAYSSHSQAVLDCLRNRNEWAQLVDRGPKTNASRKRRKPDADPPVLESELEGAKARSLNQVESKSVDSNREDFPKGKRQARKRRRLALQGRGVKEVRKRQKADAITDDDLGGFSHSSEGTESIFSEDEIPGDNTRGIGNEVSTSSSDERPN